MTRVLILFAHPALERSRVHRRLLDHRPDLPGLTFHDLYEAYPAFDIDVEREQKLLAEHDIIVVQHPFFWYSTPPLVKQWEDLVLEHGWAYGRTGNALSGKRWVHFISTGGAESAYQRDGHNRFTIPEFLVPLQQTVRLCRMLWIPPWVIPGTHRMTEDEIGRAGLVYAELLTRLSENGIDPEDVARFSTLNEALPSLPVFERRR
jgi:glutathione-regulated potassium-efflux system ancillary protein KefG